MLLKNQSIKVTLKYDKNGQPLPPVKKAKKKNLAESQKLLEPQQNLFYKAENYGLDNSQPQRYDLEQDPQNES